MSNVACKDRPSGSWGEPWFAPKMYGYGSGLPISWQGWATLGAFIALVIADLASPGRDRGALTVAAFVAFAVICALKTRGGWRWRWGERS